MNRNQTVLVVEDDLNDRVLITEAFRQNGVKSPIQVVGGAYEAIAYLKDEGKYADRTRFGFPAFILTDLKMPHGNGFELLQYLKQTPDFGGIPPAVLTASRDT